MPTYKEIVQKISELQRQADELRANEQATVIAEIKQKIVEYGLSADDLGFDAKGGPASKKAGRKVPVRYRDGQGNTWTGRGKRPGWLVKELSAGKKMEDFLVA
ncbi:H-NS family nucleoid-associated regulatory protein, partial [Ralstonia solanacearum]|uniref:H-NS histone family protein n=1 Tax=Ralstonia solanacearum TaxID=305 RepID=UPI0034DD0713